MKITTPISVGELLDKISILKIKQDKITNQDKLKDITHELDELLRIANSLEDQEAVSEYISRLHEVNSDLWEVEDNIRIKEKQGKFDDEFIQLARKVYITNDERFDVKNEVNSAFNSDIVEQKSYEEY